jgi:hypothetical protein
LASGCSRLERRPRGGPGRALRCVDRPSSAEAASESTGSGACPDATVAQGCHAQAHRGRAHRGKQGETPRPGACRGREPIVRSRSEERDQRPNGCRRGISWSMLRLGSVTAKVACGDLGLSNVRQLNDRSRSLGIDGSVHRYHRLVQLRGTTPRCTPVFRGRQGRPRCRLPRHDVEFPLRGGLAPRERDRSIRPPRRMVRACRDRGWCGDRDPPESDRNTGRRSRRPGG